MVAGSAAGASRGAVAPLDAGAPGPSASTDAAGPSGHVDYRTLVEQIPCITDTEVHDRTTSKGQRTTFVSPQVVRILRYANISTSPQTVVMFGYTPREWKDIPELWTRLIHPEESERILASQARYKDGGSEGVFDEEYRIAARDGRLVWVRDVALVMREGRTTA